MRENDVARPSRVNKDRDGDRVCISFECACWSTLAFAIRRVGVEVEPGTYVAFRKEVVGALKFRLKTH